MFFERGFHQACNGPLHVINHIINHIVESDVYVLFNCKLSHLQAGSNIEAQDNGVRDFGQHDI